MKMALFIGVSSLLMCSCVETSNPTVLADLPDDEVKSRAEVEEIIFEKDSVEEVLAASNQEPREEEIDPLYTGCVFPKSELQEDSLILPPKLVGCFHYPATSEEVFDIPEIEAQFPGGIIAMKQFIDDNMIYPNRDEGTFSGKVYVAFVVSEDGSIRDEVIVRGLSEAYNQEALRIIRLMPRWIPAENNGKIVAARVRLPIDFKLN